MRTISQFLSGKRPAVETPSASATRTMDARRSGSDQTPLQASFSQADYELVGEEWRRCWI